MLIAGAFFAFIFQLIKFFFADSIDEVKDVTKSPLFVAGTGTVCCIRW